MDSIKWNNQQERAFKAINKWLSDPSGQQIFRLFGYAGTGKTTMAKHLVQDMNDPVFCAYTGKAAHVLKKKGCPNVSTIHQLIYHPEGDTPTERLYKLQEELDSLIVMLKKTPLLPGVDMEKFLEEHIQVQILKEKIQKEKTKSKPQFFLNEANESIWNADVIVVDECSMVNEEIANDLMHFKRKILVLGDPFQLPPVRGNGFFINAKPDVLLDDVERQTKDSPVLWLATEVRQGRKIKRGDYGESRVIGLSDINKDIALQADQILVGTNKKRKAINERIRDLRGFISPVPLEGERVICLRNDHKIGILNGATYKVEECVVTDNDYGLSLLTVTEEGTKDTKTMEAFLHHFQERDMYMSRWEKMEAQEFDYAYGITVHKFQGSQARDVLLFDQSSVFKGSSAQWLYTGITRAEEKITIVS